jgi:hypothetical protein
MREITKYPLQSGKFTKISLPIDSIILSAFIDNFEVFIHVVTDPDTSEIEIFNFALFSTNDTIDDHYLINYTFIGTLVGTDGFMQHLFYQ